MAIPTFKVVGDNENPEVPFTSYVSIEDTAVYLKHKVNFYVWDSFDVETKQDLLVYATNYIDARFNFAGQKADPKQPLAYPRVIGDGDPFMPEVIRRATAIMALVLAEYNPDVRYVALDTFRASFDLGSRVHGMDVMDILNKQISRQIVINRD